MGRLVNKAPRTGFNRPSISTGTPVVREWKTVPVKTLVEGDIISGFGLVNFIIETCNWDEFYIEAGVSNKLVLDGNSEILAFVRKVI